MLNNLQALDLLNGVDEDLGRYADDICGCDSSEYSHEVSGYMMCDKCFEVEVDDIKRLLIEAFKKTNYELTDAENLAIDILETGVKWRG